MERGWRKEWREGAGRRECKASEAGTSWRWFFENWWWSLVVGIVVVGMMTYNNNNNNTRIMIPEEVVRDRK